MLHTEGSILDVTLCNATNIAGTLEVFNILCCCFGHFRLFLGLFAWGLELFNFVQEELEGSRIALAGWFHERRAVPV